MNQIRTIIAAASLLLAALPAMPAPAAPVISSMEMVRSEAGAAVDQLTITYTIDRAAAHVASSRDLIITPVLQYEGGSLELTPVMLSGRNAYIAHQRNGGIPKGTVMIPAKGAPVTRQATLPWNYDYRRSTLTFRTERRGCACKSDGKGALPENLYVDFCPKFNLITPWDQLRAMEGELETIVKTRSLARTAHVNYRVNSTVLDPKFSNNAKELAGILATIDSVRNDRNLTVDKVNIHGFASPEGGYQNNARLAQGRTEALRKYVDQHYGFGRKLTASSTPEDWAGLRKWVEASTLADKAGILAVIDSSLTPDEKDAKIRTQYPASYKILLNDVYPSLRRTDYLIEYTIRTFTDPSQISEILKKDPTMLSYEEMMILVRSQDTKAKQDALMMKAADEYFPDDERAQLNAAFLSLAKDDTDAAARYLSKAGTTPLADYARGVLMLYTDRRVEALPLLQRAAKAGVKGAAEALASAR